MIALAMRNGARRFSCAECERAPCSMRAGPGERDEVGCPECRGEQGRESCTLCEGSGYMKFKKCPARAVAADDGVRTFLLARDMTKNHGVLPAAGGFLDQTHVYVEALAFAGLVEAEMKE